MESEKWVIYNKAFKKYWNAHEGWTTQEKATLYPKKYDLSKEGPMNGVWLLRKVDDPITIKSIFTKLVTRGGISPRVVDLLSRFRLEEMRQLLDEAITAEFCYEYCSRRLKDYQESLKDLQELKTKCYPEESKAQQESMHEALEFDEKQRHKE